MKEETELENAVSTSTSEVERRISALVAEFGSRTAAAKVAGISTDQLSRYETGASPRMAPIAKLCQAVGWSLDYVWFGTKRTEQAENEDDQADGSEFVSVPQYDVEVAAGDGRIPGAEQVIAYYAFRRDWVRRMGWTTDQLAIVICRGDSQEGVIDDGQPVLVNLADHDVSKEGLFVLRLDDNLLIKTLQMDWQGNVLLRSNNPRYREIQVPKDRIDYLHVLGRAVWTDRLL